MPSPTPPPPSLPLAKRLERLVRAGPELTGELSLEGVLQRVANLAREILEARYAAIGLLAEDGRTLKSFTTSGLTPEERQRIGNLPEGRGILGLVIRRGEIVRLDDLSAHPDSAGFPANHPPMRSFLGVPVLGRRGVLGDLYLTEKLGGGSFTKEDEDMALLLAATTAAAVENASLHEESARLLEEVQDLQRSRERFFAMVNHELRNALAAVYGWGEMLVRKKDPETVPRAAFEVLDSAEQAVSLVNDLLDLSRMDEDRLKPVLKEVDCRGVVRQAVARLTPTAEAKGVRLEARLPEELPTCVTDARRVEQILVNILGNAVRHTPDHSTVTVTVACTPPQVLFTVEDEGPGLVEDDLERVFDLYATSGPDKGGSGLGLPLSRRLARLLGGDLVARARAKGGPTGGCFVLSLDSTGKLS